MSTFVSQRAKRSRYSTSASGITTRYLIVDHLFSSYFMNSLADFFSLTSCRLLVDIVDLSHNLAYFCECCRFQKQTFQVFLYSVLFDTRSYHVPTRLSSICADVFVDVIHVCSVNVFRSLRKKALTTSAPASRSSRRSATNTERRRTAASRSRASERSSAPLKRATSQR